MSDGPQDLPRRKTRKRLWRRFVPKGLVPRLILALTIIVAFVAGTSGYIDLRSQEESLLEQVKLSADQLSDAIVNATWHAMLEDRREAAYAIMQTVARQKGIEKVRIFNKEGRIVFSTADDNGMLVDKKTEACDLCHASGEPLVHVDVESRSRVFQHADGTRVLGMVRPVYNESSCSTAACHAHPPEIKVLGVLDVGMSLDRLDVERDRVRNRALVWTLVEIALLALCIVFLTRRVVGKPLNRLTGAIQSLGPANLAPPAGENALPAELGEPELSFSAMKARLALALHDLNTLTRDLEVKVEERTAELKSAQERLAQSERMASLGQLAATVAHEVNNPVASVLNLAKVMQRIVTDEGIPTNRVTDVRRYLDLMTGETARVGRIVQDLLIFSRQSRPRFAPVDLNSLVETTVANMLQRFASRNLQIELESKLIPQVPCDEQQIQQVLVNLLSNAADAVQDGATIHVRTRLDEEGERAVIEVEDPGVGISPEHMNRLFDPFFTTKAEGRALGLGLAIAYGIAQAHGGSIGVQSVPGKGSTFRILLPLQLADSVGAES